MLTAYRSRSACLSCTTTTLRTGTTTSRIPAELLGPILRTGGPRQSPVPRPVIRALPERHAVAFDHIRVVDAVGACSWKQLEVVVLQILGAVDSFQHVSRKNRHRGKVQKIAPVLHFALHADDVLALGNG